MRKLLMTFPLLVALQGGAALADEDCFVPMAQWQPRAAVAKLAAEKGWTVRRIRIDDGCYQVEGRDAQGRRIEATIHPATLQVIRTEEGEGSDD